MKYKKILFLFLVALAACLSIRTVQVFYTIDGATGFFKPSFADIGFKMAVVVLGIIVVMAIVAFTVQRCPNKMPKVNPVLGISSIALSAGILYELANTTFSARIPMWQVVLLDISGILSAIFFVAYGIKFIHNYSLPRKLYIIPVIYWMVKLVFTFTSISSLALITDNVFMVFSYCAVLIFMLEFAKLANNRDIKYNHKKLFAAASCSVLLCACVAGPRMLAILMGHVDSLHESLSSMLPMITVGLFIAAFSVSHFSNSNLSKHRRIKVKRLSKPGEEIDGFYLGDSNN